MMDDFIIKAIVSFVSDRFLIGFLSIQKVFNLRFTFSSLIQISSRFTSLKGYSIKLLRQKQPN